jgi:hypothetical protein
MTLCLSSYVYAQDSDSDNGPNDRVGWDVLIRDFRALVVLWFLQSFLLRFAMGGWYPINNAKPDTPDSESHSSFFCLPFCKGPLGPSVPDYPPVHPMLQTITPYTITMISETDFLRIIMLTFLAVASRATIACRQR